MHITIFGVGRSGTKAIQLYLSYILALIEEKVWINYEPYFWIDRKTQTINYDGYFVHLSSPHILTDPNALSSRHRNFLEKLKHHDVSVVSKFIRANGRINVINNIINPDYSFLVIRNLYDVLYSLLRTEWDFWSVGWEFRIDWDKFVNEARQSNLLNNFDWCIQNIADRIDQNAFYWYVMNKAALNLSGKNVAIITYKDISQVEVHAKKIFGNEWVSEKMSDKKFDGGFLHLNYPLESHERYHIRQNFFNHFLYKTKLTARYGVVFQSQIGSLATINKDYYIERIENKHVSRISLEKKDLYEFFIEDINADIKKFLPKAEPELNLS